MRSKLLVPLVAAALAGCRTPSPEELPAHGLPLVELRMDSEQQGILNSATFEKIPVRAEVVIEGKARPVQVHYSGKSTLDDFKKSFELKLVDGRFRGRKEYRLSAQSVDATGGLRSRLGYEVLRRQGLDVPRMDPVTLYVNREPAGLYHWLEPIDDEFFAARGIAADPVYKAVYGNADYTAEALAKGDEAFDVRTKPKSYAPLTALIEAVQAERSDESRARLESLLDVDLYLRYVAAAVYLNHFDGFTNNVFLYLDVPGKRFRLVPWDLDRIYERAPYQLGNSLWGGNALTRRLLSYPDLKRKYVAILQTLVRDTLPLSVLHALIDEMAAEVAEAFAHDRVLTARGRTSDGAVQELKEITKEWLEALGEDVRRQAALLDVGGSP